MATKNTTRPRPAGLDIEIVTDPKERRRLQNRIAQRNSRRRRAATKREKINLDGDSSPGICRCEIHGCNTASRPVEPSSPKSPGEIVDSLGLGRLEAEISQYITNALISPLSLTCDDAQHFFAEFDKAADNSSFDPMLFAEPSLGPLDTIHSDAQQGTSYYLYPQEPLTPPPHSIHQTASQIMLVTDPEATSTTYYPLQELSPSPPPPPPPLPSSPTSHNHHSLPSQNLSQDISQGKTPLHLAAETGHLPILALLLQNGAKVNTTDDKGQTALHHAAQQGYAQIAELLLEWGADPLLPDCRGFSPLHLAVAEGLEEVVRVFVERKGVDPNIYSGFVGSGGLVDGAGTGSSAAAARLLVVEREGGTSRDDIASVAI